MRKHAFIPPSYRPSIPGGKLRKVEHPSSPLPAVGFSGRSSAIVILSAHDDLVSEQFLKLIAEYRSPVFHLYYDDLGVTWDFSFEKQNLKFYCPELTIIPTAIYHRHPGVSRDNPSYHRHVAFFEVLDLWKGNLIGQRRDHHANTSKAYQSIVSIRAAIRDQSDQIQCPRSFFVKGTFECIAKDFQGSLVVKSASNVRSQVVCEETFCHWQMDRIQHLPTLFQQRIEGDNIRIHVCDGKIWALLVHNHSTIDYRYAPKGEIRYRHFDLPAGLEKFCVQLSSIEKNRLIGVDLIKIGENYFCLESNPGPGWSTFSHPSREQFAKVIFEQLLESEL